MCIRDRLELVPGFLYSLYLIHYKTDISLRRTLTAGPKGVRLRGSWLYISYTLYVVFDIYFTFFLKYGWFSPLQKTCNSCQTGTNCVWLLTAIVEDPIVDEMFLFAPLFRVIIKQIFLLISIQCNWYGQTSGLDIIVPRTTWFQGMKRLSRDFGSLI